MRERAVPSHTPPLQNLEAVADEATLPVLKRQTAPLQLLPCNLKEEYGPQWQHLEAKSLPAFFSKLNI